MVKIKLWISVLICFGLILLLNGFVVGQDNPVEATSDASATDTQPFLPTVTSLPTTEIIAETPIPTETPLIPTFTDVPTETVIIPPATEILPTQEHLTTTPADLSATPTEVTTATALATTTVEPTITAVDSLPSEPELALFASDNFESGDFSSWSFGPGWVRTPHEDGQGIQVFNSNDAMRLIGADQLSVAAQASFQVSYGTGRLNIRDSQIGNYSLTLDANGQVNLYRAGVLLQSTNVSATQPGQWRILRLSAIGDVLRAAIDGTEVITVQDAAPLPPGTITLGGLFTISTDARLPQNTVQIDDFFAWKPTSELSPPTPTATVTATPTTMTITKPQQSMALGEDMVSAQAVCDPNAPVTKISTGYDGSPANQRSYNSVVSGDGRYITYVSEATNIVTGDTNNHADLFRYDRQTCTTVMVSVAPDGVTPGNLDSVYSAMSADGHYITFQSAATNLVSSPTVTTWTIYLRDMQTNITTLVSKAPNGAAANGQSRNPAISEDGRYVVYQSEATNLTGETDTAYYDIFVYDRVTDQTTRVSKTPTGTQSFGDSTLPEISGNDRYIVYTSVAANIVSEDSNGSSDVFLYDQTTGQNQRVSIPPSGTQNNNGPSYVSAISDDGNLVAFIATNTTQDNVLYVRNRSLNQTIQISLPVIGTTVQVSASIIGMSADGRYTAFTSVSNNLVYGDSNNYMDVFLHDRQSYKTMRVSTGINGAQTNDHSFLASLSSDGSVITYYSAASNIVTGDTNSVSDIFVVNLQTLPPAAPANLQGTSANNTTVHLTWQDASSNETEFRIERSVDGTNWTSVGTAAMDELTFTSSGLTCNMQYFYRVSAFDGNRSLSSPPSPTVTIRTQPCQPVQTGPVFTVNVTNDVNDTTCSGDNCSLREAIIAANNYSGGSATVVIPDGTYTLSLAGLNEDAALLGDLDILANITITGAGATSTIIDGGGIDRVFHILSNRIVTITDVTIQGGLLTAAGQKGGGVFIAQGATLNVNRSHIRNNTAPFGGGFEVGSSTLNLTESTVFNNTAIGSSGGFSVDKPSSAPGVLNLIRSTVTDNTAPSGSIATISSSTFNSTESTMIGDKAGVNISGTNVGSILTSSTAGFGPLGDNGGPTWTRALLPNSTYIGIGADTCSATDQRGHSRNDGRCDAGAYEANYAPFVKSTGAFDNNAVDHHHTAFPTGLLPTSIIQLDVWFSEGLNNPTGDTDPTDVTNPSNYQLFNAGSDQIIQTNQCGTPQGDDQSVVVNKVTFDVVTTTALLDVNGGLPLPTQKYLLLVCGANLRDFDGNALDVNQDNIGGETYSVNFNIQLPQAYPNLTVDLTVDTNDGICGVGNCSLREAIIAANAYSTGGANITIPAGLYTLSLVGNDDTSALGDLDITKSVTINGMGAANTIIDGGGIDRVFHVKNAGTVTITGLTIRNGAPINASNGGGIWIASTNTTIANTAIINNTAGDSGGGIVIDGGASTNVTILNSLISGNKTTGFSNPTLYGRGGGIFNWGNLTVVNSTISGNSSNKWGGGILNYGIVSLNNVTVTGNTADSDHTNDASGGGLYNATGTNIIGLLYVKNSLIANNQDLSGVATDCGGTGFYTSQNNNLIGNTTGCQLTGDLDHNIINVNPLLDVLANNGGQTQTHALLAGSPAINAGDNLTCAKSDQRGVYRPQGTACDIGAYELTGGAFNTIPPAVIKLTKIVTPPNAVTNLQIDFSEPMQNPLGDNNANDVTNPTNYRVITPGTDHIFQTSVCSATVGDDVTIPVNSVTYNASFYNITLSINGGTALPINTYRLIVCASLRDTDGNTLDGNLDSTPGDDHVENFIVDGAQVGPTFNVNTTEDVNDGTCGTLHCTLREAIIAANAYTTGTPTVNIPAGTYLLTITGTSETLAATGDLNIRRGMQIIGAESATTIIDGNQRDRVFANSASGVVLSNLTIQNGRTPTDVDGGGILNSGGLTLTNIIVKNNTSRSASGGGIRNTGTLTTSGSTITGNTADDGAGGGIYNTGTLTIVSSTLSNNVSTNGVIGGGGIHNEGGTVTIDRSTISGNTALSGGGVSNRMTAGIMTITNSTISGNTANPYSGGGVEVGVQSTTTLNNVTVSNNTAGGQGGGLYVDLNAKAQFTNTLIAGNIDVGGEAPDCSIIPNSTLESQDYNLIGTTLGCTITGQTAHNVTNVDPHLDVLADNGGGLQTHALLTGSPALNAGNNATCRATDERGVSRPQQSVCDIGAFEAASIPVSQIPPLVLKTEYNTNLDLGEGFSDEVTLTQISVTFNETMSDPAGNTQANDVTNTANYRLLAAGANGTFETSICGALQGDDGAITINSVAYNIITGKSTLTLNGGLFLPANRYRLLVCETLNDLDGNALDGNVDGLPGGNFVRNFNITSSPTTVTSVSDNASNAITEGILSERNITGFTITFSRPVQDLTGNNLPHDVTNPSSYLLVKDGADNTFQTAVCGTAQGDDQLVPITAVTYTSGSKIASLSVNGGAALAAEHYRLFVCANASTGIQNVFGAALDGNSDGTGGDDFVRNFNNDPPQPAPDIYVNNQTSLNDGICNQRDCSLYEAVALANSYVPTTGIPLPAIANPEIIIHIPAGTYTLTTASLQINSNAHVKLIGAGWTTQISGNGQRSAIIINDDALVNISNVKIFATTGYAVVNNAATTTLTEVSITGSQFGGGVSNKGSLTVIRSLIANNSNGSGTTGGNTAQGAGIYSTVALTVIDSTISGNQLYHNGSSLKGAGIYQAGWGPLIIDGSTITGNGSGLVDSGGGVYSYGGSPTKISNSTITGNIAQKGGGLFLSSVEGDVVLNNITVTGNQSSQSSAGGIVIWSDSLPAQIGNSIIWGNPTNDISGRITSMGYNLIGTLTGATVTGDTTSNLIGVNPLLSGLQDNGGATLTQLPLAGSPAINTGNNATCQLLDQRGVLRPQQTTCDIGAVEVSTLPVSQIPPVITRLNTVADTGDGSLNEGENTAYNITQFKLSFSAAMYDPAGNTDPNDATNPNNYRLLTPGLDNTIQTVACGAVQGDDQTVAINSANYDSTSRIVTLGMSGGVSLPSSKYRLLACPTLRDTNGNLLDGNYDTSAGDIFVRNFMVEIAQAGPILAVNTTADVDDGVCTETNCSLREAIRLANLNAGMTINIPAGVYKLTIAGRGEDNSLKGDLDILNSMTLQGAGPDLTIIDGNHLDRVFHIDNTNSLPMNVTLSGLTIRNGDDNISDLSRSHGGGLSIDTDTTVILQDSIVTNSGFARYGGGIANYGTLTILRSTIQNNQGQYGGGIYNANVLTIINSNIQNNTAVGTNNVAQGGGIYTNDQMNLTNITINGNQSQGDGGGIYYNRLTYGYALPFTNVTISGNTAAQNGGGLMLTSDLGAANINLKNVTITNNTALAGDGGGLYILTIRNALGDNLASFRNSIVAGNIDNSGTTRYPDFYPSVDSQGYNLFGNINNVTVTGNTAGNIWNVAALLGPLQNNGGYTMTHALLTGSPAINNGFNSYCPSTDQRGIARPQGSTCDIGAYEAETSLTIPGNLTGTANSSSITLNWNDTATETEFQLERSNDGLNGWMKIATNSANVLTYVDSGLACDQSYSYRVRAYRNNEALLSQPSNVITLSTNKCSTDLSIDIIKASDPIVIGTSQTYILTVRNLSPKNAYGVVITDNLPMHTSFESATSSIPMDCQQSNNTITCMAATLAANSTQTVNIKTNLSPVTQGAITNAASVISDSPDPITNNNSATAVTTITEFMSTGSYQEDNLNLSIKGNWITYNGTGPKGGTYKYTNQDKARISFAVNNTVGRITIYRTMYSIYGSTQIFVDGAATPIATMNNTSATLLFGVPFTIAIPPGNHVIDLQNVGTSYSGIDQIDLLPAASALSTTLGTYQEAETNLSYSGLWVTNNAASALGGSRSYTNDPNATVSFNIDNTVGRVTIYRTTYAAGVYGSLQVFLDGATTPLTTINNTSANFIYGVPYSFEVIPSNHTITLKNVGSTYSDLDQITVQAPAATLNTGTYQETNSELTYTGIWTDANATGALGGSRKYTNDPNAKFSFNIDNTVGRVTIYRTTYAAGVYGSLQVFVDGATIPLTTINNTSAAFVYGQPFTFIVTPGNHTITLKNVGSTYSDLDQISLQPPTAALSTGTYQETNSELTYMGTWTGANATGALGGSRSYTNDPNASVSFSINNTVGQVTIYRSTYAAGVYGSLQVFLDGATTPLTTITNTSASFLYGQPFTFVVTPGNHVITLKNVGSTYSDLDQITLAAAAPLTLGTYQENESNLIYNGTWTSTAASAALGGSRKYTNDPNASVSFSINNTVGQVTIYRSTYAAGVYGSLQVFLDGATTPLTTINNTSAAFLYGQPFTFVVTPGNHVITLKNVGSTYSDLDQILLSSGT